jgi:hypothetical protein
MVVTLFLIKNLHFLLVMVYDFRLVVHSCTLNTRKCVSFVKCSYRILVELLLG